MTGPLIELCVEGIDGLIAALAHAGGGNAYAGSRGYAYAGTADAHARDRKRLHPQPRDGRIPDGRHHDA